MPKTIREVLATFGDINRIQMDAPIRDMLDEPCQAQYCTEDGDSAGSIYVHVAGDAIVAIYFRSAPDATTPPQSLYLVVDSRAWDTWWNRSRQVRELPEAERTEALAALGDCPSKRLRLVLGAMRDAGNACDE